MPPANTSAVTATDLGSLPATVVQTVHEAGTTYTVWYKYTAVAGEVVIGVWGFGGTVGAGYQPIVSVWQGPAAAPTRYPNAGDFIEAQQKRIQVPVTPGTTYFFRFVPNSATVSPAVLTIDARTAPQDAYDGGDFLINNDTAGFEAAILNAADTTAPVRQFRHPFPAGDGSACLFRGGQRLLISDDASQTLYLYESGLTQVAILTDPGKYWKKISSNLLDTFYVGRDPGAPSAAAVSTVSATGVFGSTEWTLAGAGLTGFVVNGAATILYYQGAGPTNNAPVRRHDLVTDLPLSNLAAGPGTGYFAQSDLLVDAADNVIVGWARFSPLNVVYRRYTPAGAILNTYTFDTYGALATTPIRLVWALDYPTSFWVWLHLSSGLSTFVRVRVSDGVILTVLTGVRYQTGVYAPAETAVPLAAFGHPLSCPLIVLPIAGGGGGGGGTAADGCPLPLPSIVTGLAGCVAPHPGIV